MNDQLSIEQATSADIYWDCYDKKDNSPLDLAGFTPRLILKKNTKTDPVLNITGNVSANQAHIALTNDNTNIEAGLYLFKATLEKSGKVYKIETGQLEITDF